PAARQENHGAAPTSCSGSKRRSLNSLKNCLDRWVHFTDQLRDECYDGYNLLLEQQSNIDEHFERQRLHEIYDYVDVEGLPLYAKDAICQVFEHMLVLWGKYEALARTLTKLVSLADDNDPDPDLTKAVLFG
ncbi:hypothetical protein ISH75_34740, partial [Pseudomonas aeruginosa]|nr:hypothetical protein [Pseudomonas aeruginosa]